MKTFLFLLCLPAFAVVPVVSGIVTDDVNVNGGHSSVRVTWNSDIGSDNVRLEWGTTSAYGNIFYGYATNGNGATWTTGQQLILTGQIAGGTIHLAPESHNASGWSSPTGLDQTITFPALPSPHPLPATLPSTFSLEPDMSGAVALTANSKAALQTAIDTAVAGQCTNKYVITVSGTISGTVVPNYSCDADLITSVNASTDTITFTATGYNTYHNGDQVRIMHNGYLGGILPPPLLDGVSYCVSNLVGSTMKLTVWPACTALVDITGAGSPYFWVRLFPPPITNYIQIRGPATGVPPIGVRPDPSWVSTWPNMNYPNPTATPANMSLRFNGTSTNFYVGPGLHFTCPNSNQTTTTDPYPYYGWISSEVSVTNLAIKRNVFSCGYPERMMRPIFSAEGSYFDFSDNYWDDVSYFRPTNNGIFSTGLGTGTLTFSAGGFWTNIGNCPSVPSFTASAPTGTGVAWFTLNPATCLPLATVNSGASVTMSLGMTAVGTAFPVNASFVYSQALLASYRFTAGVFYAGDPVNGITNWPDTAYSVFNTEGPQTFTSCGPGPLNVRNNYLESHGIIWHLDDTCSATPTRFVSNALFARNVFNSPLKYVTHSATNNGASFSNRNQWESKTGQYMWLDGNRFFGEYANINAGPSILINHHDDFCTAVPCVGGVDSDFTATNNYFANNAGCFQLGGGPPNETGVPPLGRRFTIRNNTCANVNGYTYGSPQGSNIGRGFCFFLSFGGEDVILDKNSCYAIGGVTSVWLEPISKFIEGLAVTNNVLFFNEDDNAHGIKVDWGSAGTGVPNCANLAGKAALDCYATPNYIWSNNLVMGGFTSTATQSGNSSAAAIATAYTGLPNTFLRAEATVAGRVSAAKWINATTPSTSQTNFRWAASSPYIAGGGSASTDGSDLGANQNTAQDAQGIIKNVRALSITTTGFAADFHSPDTGTSCYIGYGTGTDPSGWAVIGPNTQTVKERSIAVTGLATKTVYNWQVWCAGTEPSATQAARTL